MMSPDSGLEVIQFFSQKGVSERSASWGRCWCLFPRQGEEDVLLLKQESCARVMCVEKRIVPAQRQGKHNMASQSALEVVDVSYEEGFGLEERVSQVCQPV